MSISQRVRLQFKQYNKKETLKAFLFLLPALILGTLFIILPISLSIIYGFTDYYLLTPDETKFVGLKNFAEMLKDPMVIKAFKNTAYFVVMVIPIQVGAALALAVLVNKKFKLNTIFRTAFYAPNIISLVVLALLWNMLLSPNGGLINTLLESAGLSAQPFLSSPNQSMPTIMFISSWQGAGFQMMIFLAGLSNIPTDQYEAADIDGANKWKQFLYITLPGLRPVAVFVLITTIISAFKLIVQPMVMTGGGPLDSTLTIVYHIFNVGYKFRYVGYASAIALTFTLVLLPISILQSKLGKEQ